MKQLLFNLQSIQRIAKWIDLCAFFLYALKRFFACCFFNCAHMRIRVNHYFPTDNALKINDKYPIQLLLFFSFYFGSNKMINGHFTFKIYLSGKKWVTHLKKIIFMLWTIQRPFTYYDRNTFKVLTKTEFEPICKQSWDSLDMFISHIYQILKRKKNTRFCGKTRVICY